MSHRFTLLLAGLLTASAALAQPVSLTLDDVVSLAREQSLAGKQAATLQKTNYWTFRTFMAGFKPQLSLSGSLPSFTRSFVQVIQPDGTIVFQPVSNNNSILSLSLSQNIPLTGGSIYVQQQVQRFDNFLAKNTLYNGVPFEVGLSQPLFRFNQMKWDRQTEPLRYAESNQQYIEAMEQVALDATGFYFDLLVAQVNLQIAETNRANNDTLYKIAQHKLTLGRISRNDLLQLQLSVLNAQKDLASARQTAEVAALKLRSFVGSRDDRPLALAIPNRLNPFTVDIKLALEQAFANRSAALTFRRQQLEADRDLEKARKENGLNATLNASFGLSNRGSRPTDLYVQPQDRQFVEIQFVLPIMTWGRAKARTETALATQQLTVQIVEQNKRSMEQQIYTQVTLLDMLRQQVTLTAEADQIAQNRYQIAQDRFKLSDLSVTDLGIATQDKDRARRDAILALRDYWQVYYTIRLLTLYDFETNQKLTQSR
ncbi:TolC family protein [Spirosoma rhododendri]|uniref:TolC family protein n=1 Tax=Spirosoma rhododendri TaxID=2728024 RepID=A0A7L5DSF3_9BACT|nr:TolC family protein [Spirosoma rhododendri]QJD80381.1 TolC family protein [Spirosoma rhododendri]